jgi:hypothetical protein
MLPPILIFYLDAVHVGADLYLLPVTPYMFVVGVCGKVARKSDVTLPVR